MHSTKLFSAVLIFILLSGCATPAIEKGTVPIRPSESSGSASDPSAPSPSETEDPQAENSKTGSPEVRDFYIELEGMQEKVTWTRYTGKNFSIFYDAEKFVVDAQDGATDFRLTNPDPNIYPEVFMSIRYEEGASAAEKADSLAAGSLSPDPGTAGLTYKSAGEVEIGELKARKLHAPAGSTWDSPTADVYFIDANRGCYTIILHYYLEAAEGWGARMGSMVGTFVPA
jgi:hypothetical protein